MSLYIKNGRLVDPKSGLDRVCDILCVDGKIEGISQETGEFETLDKSAGELTTKRERMYKILEDPSTEMIDAAGMIVAPGLVDVHSHFRDPGQTQKEDILTGAEAAAAGGYTSIIMMANTVPTVDNEETLSYVLEKGRNTKINIYACANVTAGMQGEHITDMKTLHRAGAVGFTDDGKPIVDEALLRSAMKTCAELNVPISLHEEDPAYVGVAGVNEGEVSRKMGVRGADRQAEITMVERDLKIAMETGAAVDIQHISAAESVELVRQARE
ncbi:MAG: amidohydrolase family protein, partial [Lachnospiraceae bacterium]|nr:amidohydrolase family protein [Lachnospiraceae bacterium]